MTGPRSAALKLWLFFYGNGNIAGSALALLGPILLFAGVIEAYWLPITLGLYAAGFTLARGRPELERQIEHTLTAEETLARFDALVARANPHLTPDMREHLTSVRSSVAEVLPRLLAAQALNDDLFTVRETVLRYVPETLANYVALPPVFRVTHVLKDGKTARQLLAEQLAILDDKLREVVANVAARDAQALLENGRFLELKFKHADFLAS
jgi:hypothetical protein